MIIGERSGLAPWLVIALATVTCCARAGTDVKLSLQPAWGGHVKPALASELGVRLLSARGGAARVTVRASQAVASSTATVEAGLPLELRFPLLHDTAEPVAVELEIDGRAVRRENLELRVLPSSTTVVAMVSGDKAVEWPQRLMSPMDARVLHLGAGELPHSGQAYRLLSALYLQESALRGMTGTQRQALADYAAACGLLYITGTTSKEGAALRRAAGCGGRYLIVSALGAEGIVGAAATPAVGRMPGATTLADLVPEGTDTVLRSVFVFLAGYITVLLLVARTATAATAMLAVPPAAAALAILAWSLASPRVQVASLAEMDSGDPLARFAALLQVTGTAPRELVLGLPSRLGLPLSPTAGQPTRIEIQPAARRFGLRLDTRLMSHHSFRVEGIARASELTVESSATGVRVTNRGDATSAPATVAWRGRPYTVPELAAGQQWSQPDEAGAWGHTAPQLILRERATDGGSWLLVRHDIPALASLAGTGDAAGWLLVRGLSSDRSREATDA